MTAKTVRLIEFIAISTKSGLRKPDDLYRPPTQAMESSCPQHGLQAREQ